MKTFLVILAYCFSGLICISCSSFSCNLISNGGFLQRQVTIRKSDSPCTINNDLTVMEKFKLTLAPGSELRFAPRVTLGVNGTLIAQGTAEERIKFTKAVGLDVEPKWADDIRLVDDFSVHLGRLEILYKTKWRGICANFINWTQSDVDVACKQLGFKTGNFSFLSWSRNHSSYMLYYKPSCTGKENSILECPGAQKIRFGRNICKKQQTVHLLCRGLPEDSMVYKEYWSGIEFYNTTIYKSINEQTTINESTSILEYVDILYAGSGQVGNAIPALRGNPHVPHLKHVNILHSALDATNFTNVFSSTLVHNSSFVNNRGHGIVVESHLGHVQLTDNVVSNNHGNGIKVKFLDGRHVIYDKEMTFCVMADLASQTYPQIIYGIPNLGRFCERKFFTQRSNRITFNVIEMDIEPGARGTLTVYDGEDERYPVLGAYSIINGTLPSGVTSSYHVMMVRFEWFIPSNVFCSNLRTCIKFTVLIDSSPESAPELFVNNTVVNNNLQHGVFIENIRNYVAVNASKITRNGYGAGIRVYGGAGDILINSTIVDHNQDNGVNITVDGGWRIFNRSSFSYNYGNGVNMTFNETSIDNRTRYAKQQRTEVSHSYFIGNEGHGLSIGNYCRSALHVVNDSHFVDNFREGIEYLSCYKVVPLTNLTNITIGYNKFRSNSGHAIKLSPLLNSVGRTANNTFTGHGKHVLLIDNTDDLRKGKFFQGMKVDYEVEANRFENNHGVYVANFRLTQASTLQRLTVKYNIFVNNNITRLGNLNERAKSRAVVILSSDNIRFQRNHLENPQSICEISTHLREMSATIMATELWWGTTNYSEIITRIFDQTSRYNLARIRYHPSLSYSWLYGPVLTDRNMEIEVKFHRGNTLGGRLGQEFITTPGMTYHVDRDIVVDGYGRLVVKEGTIFEFENSLGMMVQGKVEFDGSTSNPIVMKLQNESLFVNNSLIRLADGKSEFEGRLEVRMNESDEWATICDQGWTLTDASVACRMFGYVVHPNDWTVKVNKPGSEEQEILRSNVDCSDLDDDLMKCDAEQEGEHSCTHLNDVYLKCYPVSWAGIYFVATAPSGRLQHVRISEAGLKDPSEPLYGPALKIDYNVHSLSNLHVLNNVDDGVQIMKNDVYAGSSLKNSIIENNQGNGLSVRGSFFDASNCIFRNNSKVGFEYNPMLSAYEALRITSSAHDYINFNRSFSHRLNDHEVKWFLTEQSFGSKSTVLEVEIEVSSHFRVMVDIVDYNPDTEQEKVTVYDSRSAQIRPGTKQWQIEQDLLDFPITSQLSVVTIRWAINGLSSGRLSFVVRSRPWDWQYPLGKLSIADCLIEHNKHGFTASLYSQPSDEYLAIFHRYNWEKIRVLRSRFQHNTYSSINVPSLTKYNRLYLPSPEELQTSLRISEVTFILDSCTFEDNGGGVVAEHVGIGFSNNVWIWELENNTFVRNRAGGVFIEFPRVNLLFTDLFNHSISVNGSNFINNNDFEFSVGGFYCNGSISSNKFQGNKCKKGCIEFTGTEKDFEFRDNEISNNIGKFMMEVNMNSHTPFTQWVEASINYNKFQGNKRPPTDLNVFSSQPTSYTFGVKGLQNVTINRNIFHNPEMSFELLGGQSSSKLENYLDVTENWWGTTDQSEITKKIFDFDDWNSFAIAEYHPFLTDPSCESGKTLEMKLRKVIDLTKPLGGRITENIKLPRRSTPYVVERDLTIMKGYSLVIEEGAKLKFHPGVGILVLGSLSAVGSPEGKIKFEPIEKNYFSRNKRSEYFPAVHQLIHPDLDYETGFQMRLRGGENEDGGFLEIFNNTEGRWSIVCDEAFNDRTAEVVCKTMNKESANVVVQRNKFYDIFVLGYPIMHEQVIEWFWRETMVCDGSETNLKECKHKINYDLPRCMEERNYVYVRCGKRNLEQIYDYWGNVRFSTTDYETDLSSSSFSAFYNVDFYGAGVLHNEKVAVVQSVYHTPDCNQVHIHNSAWNGYDYIAPTDKFTITDGSMKNINGYAVGALVLNGQSSEGESQFVPLVNSDVPHNLHGLLRMCTAEKLILLKNRALVYHRYTFDNIDCIKIIRSYEPHKQIGIRFLQLNLFNDSIYKNSLQIFNGEFFDPTQMIAELTYNSSNAERKKFHSTTKFFDTMGLRITASPAFGDYGFIAEIVTLPISPISRQDYGYLRRQLISQNLMSDCLKGGVVYKNVGENNPRVIIEKNHIRQCGLKVLNNTAPGAIDIFVQNTRLMTVANNFIVDNAGGISVNTTTKDNDASLYANVTNNVIMRNTHCEPLHLEGHHFQMFQVQNNHISHNEAEYRNIIAAFGIQLNFTSNIIKNNVAQCILNASVNEKIDINQRYHYNSIYNNHAFAYNRSTIFLKSAKFHFSYNFLLNPYNLYEMVTFNRTKYPDGVYPSVKAQNNWWGKNHRSYVGGRIWDRRDDDHLIEVTYEPFITDNSTLLDGKCYPGWKLYSNKCFMYFGGVAYPEQANAVCRANKGRLAWARDPTGREKYFGEMVARSQFNYDVNWKTWVFKDWQNEKTCSVLKDYKVEAADCSQLLPFICEKDPYIQPKMNWLPIIIATVISLIVIVFVIIPLTIFCCIKSVQRKEEKTERKETLQKSLHASRQSLNSLGGSRHSLDLINRTYAVNEPFKPRPQLKYDISSDSSLIKKELDTSSDVRFKTGYHSHDDTASSDWSGTEKSTFKYYPYKHGLPPHVENEIPLLGHSSGSSSIQKYNFPTDLESQYNDDQSHFSESSAPKPKPRRVDSSSFPTPPSSLLADLKLQYADEDDEEEDSVRSQKKPLKTKPQTKPKPPRPKLKPSSPDSEMF